MDTEALKKSLIVKFIEISADRLQKIQLGVLDLEKPNANEAADEIARELHTMKGEARMLGLAAIGQLAHAAEDLLKAAREGKAQMSLAADVLLRACDTLSDLMEDTEGAQEGNEATEAMAQALSEASGHPVPPLGGGGLKPAKGKRPPAETADALSAALDDGAPAQPAAAPRPAPPPAPQPAATAQPAAPAQPAAQALVPAKPHDDDHAHAAKSHAQDRTIRVNVELLDSLGLLAGDLLVESARAKLRGNEVAAILDRFSRMADRFLKMSERMRTSADERKSLEQVENDLHLLRDDTFRFVRRQADGINGLHGNLALMAEQVAEARLVPISTVFDAFPRAVRDMARQLDKEVDFHVENAGVGVDRSLLNDVRDALVHLLRNSVDHGIESPGQREALGKPRTGKLTIRVRADGDMLLIGVEDDGRGIDAEKLKESAISKRLLTPAQAAVLPERDAIDLIFMAGFSTRQEVTDLSGRGVGMDVVKKKVEALGGSVSITTRVGRGTTMSLRVPQTLALMRVLLIRLGDDIYGMPAADVEAVMRVKPDDRLEVFGTLAVRHRGKPVALVALGPLLGLNGGPRHDRPPAVVVRHGQDRAALAVDGFVGEREVAVKPCGGDFLKGTPFIAGSAAMEDGRIAVLLHVPDIMGEVRRLSRPVNPAAAAKRLRVLLADDSPIARATESALVKALGHSVEEAQDGEEGLRMARAGQYDLILTDVQMPRMDGFTFSRRLKSDPALARIPVIILSSLASPEDKRRGLDAGADAYLVKGELGVESLALTIDRLT